MMAIEAQLRWRQNQRKGRERSREKMETEAEKGVEYRGFLDFSGLFFPYFLCNFWRYSIFSTAWSSLVRTTHSPCTGTLKQRLDKERRRSHTLHYFLCSNLHPVR